MLRFFTRREGLKAFLSTRRGKAVAALLAVCLILLIVLFIVALLNPPPQLGQTYPVS